MKARLIKTQDTLQLLLCNGKIVFVSSAEAFEFIKTFDNPEHYSGLGKWDYETLTMEDYKGETIAFVSDDGVLHIENANLFREIVDGKDTEFVTVAEFAERYGKQSSIIRRFCRENRIPGVIQKAGTWLIPANASYPADERSR